MSIEEPTKMNHNKRSPRKMKDDELKENQKMYKQTRSRSSSVNSNRSINSKQNSFDSPDTSPLQRIENQENVAPNAKLTPSKEFGWKHFILISNSENVENGRGEPTTKDKEVVSLNGAAGDTVDYDYTQTHFNVHHETVYTVTATPKKPGLIGFESMGDNINSQLSNKTLSHGTPKQNESEFLISKVMQEETVKEGSSNYDCLSRLFKLSPFLVILFGILIFCLLKTGKTSINDNSPSKQQQQQQAAIELFEKNLHKEFQSQYDGFYSNIVSCYENSILNGRDPAVIMLVGDKNTTKDTKCIAKRVLKLMEPTSDSQSIINFHTIKSMSPSSPDEFKYELDKQLTKIFSDLKRRVAIVNDIQLIEGEPMLLFYTYGDDYDTAKFRGVITILTMELDNVLSDQDRARYAASVSKFSEFIENYLKSLWIAQVDYDQLNPLFTRIANNLILVNKDKSCNSA